VNNPLKLVDPFGHQDEPPKKKGKKGNGEDDPEPPAVIEDVVVINSAPLTAPPTTPQPESTWDYMVRESRELNRAIPRGIIRWELSPVSSAIGAIWGDQAVRDYHGAAMAILPLAVEAGW
jgi:hypothetical protein